MKPIIFNSPMVRAIISGTKTQTRRIAKGKTKPPFIPGDTLYVRETWSSVDNQFIYRATNPEMPIDREGFKWHPSIHMPFKAARIFLTVVDVRLQRLQDISQRDARSEGLCDRPNDTVKEQFARLWNNIYPTNNWKRNPVVWVVEFRKLAAAPDSTEPAPER